eukprot:15179504-Alexandrium_andersonii.AAC.1
MIAPGWDGVSRKSVLPASGLSSEVWSGFASVVGASVAVGHIAGCELADSGRRPHVVAPGPGAAHETA